MRDRKEAIIDFETFKKHGYNHGYLPSSWSIEMAIQALKQEPCEDAISREAVLEKADYTETEEGWSGYTVEVDYIKSLPPVKPQDCGTCEVGNPCIYCKHDFEPQESEEV